MKNHGTGLITAATGKWFMIMVHFFPCLDYRNICKRRKKKKMVDLNFDFYAWKETYKKYQANKNGMHFEAEVLFNAGHINIHMLSIDEKYINFSKKMTALMVSIAQGAVQYIASVFRAYYALSPEDYQTEQAKLEDNARDKMPVFLSTLFDQGIDQFVAIVLAQHQLYQCAYLLKNTELTEHGWALANGNLWNGYEFQNDAGVCTVGNLGFNEIFQNIVGETAQSRPQTEMQQQATTIPAGASTPAA